MDICNLPRGTIWRTKSTVQVIFARFIKYKVFIDADVRQRSDIFSIDADVRIFHHGAKSNQLAKIEAAFKKPEHKK